MKRNQFESSEQSVYPSDKHPTTYSFSDDKYSIQDRILHYKPNPVNTKIANELLNYRLFKKYDLIVDYEINKDIGVFVRTLEEYTKSPNEVFQLNEKFKQDSSSPHYVLKVFILIAGKEELKSPVIEEISARCVFSDFTFIACWSISSAAIYINNLKVSISFLFHSLYEKRGSEIIQKPPNQDLTSQATYVLTNVNGINKDNASVLMKKFKTMSDIMTANLDDLSEIQGLGNKRVLSLYQTFQQQKEN